MKDTKQFNQKPDSQLMNELTSLVKKKCLETHKEFIFTKNDFLKNLHDYLYEIDNEWEQLQN